MTNQELIQLINEDEEGIYQPFKLDESSLSDERAILVNNVCSLFYEKHDGDLMECLRDFEEWVDLFEDNLRNVYELIGNGIPLWGLRDLLVCGITNYFEEDQTYEYQNAIRYTKLMCHKIYKQ